jgi:glycosyltransferase involved in cell wall biosynthesis
MRIAQVSQMFEPTPPIAYGGTERVVSWLTEELVRAGHDVTLFATGDSKTSARLVPIMERAIRPGGEIRDWVPVYVALLETVRRRAPEFDLVHFHIDSHPLPLFSRQETPFLLTMHGRLDLPEYSAAYGLFREVPLVAISEFQRSFLRRQRWAATIYHGLPDMLRLVDHKGSYLAFLGRISPEKGIEAAIEISKRVGRPLKVAAKVDKVDQDYYRDVVKPKFDEAHVEFVGEIEDAQKQVFLGGASALLFPGRWPESFGLAMIEAMACGTPVIGFRVASVPEVVDDEVTGFVVEDIDEAVAAVARVDQLSRAQVRARFDARFRAERMMSDYVKVYEAIRENPS